MRKIFASLMIVALLMQTFSKTIIFSAFKLNQDYISKNLCENRNAPEKHCCGKCQLKKQLEKDEQKNDSRLPNSQKNLDEIVWMLDESSSNHLLSFLNQEIIFTNYSLKINPPFTDGILRPPSISY